MINDNYRLNTVTFNSPTL